MYRTEDSEYRTDGNAETAEPRRRIVGLSALSRFSDIDNQRARENHLCQSEESTKPEHTPHARDEQRIACQLCRDEMHQNRDKRHSDNGKLAHPLAWEPLHKVMAVRTENKYSQSVHAHDGALGNIAQSVATISTYGISEC